MHLLSIKIFLSQAGFSHSCKDRQNVAGGPWSFSPWLGRTDSNAAKTTQQLISHTTLLLQRFVCLEKHTSLVPGYPCCLPHHKPSAVVRVCSPPVHHSWSPQLEQHLSLGTHHLQTRFFVVFRISPHRQGPCTPTLPCAFLRAPIPLF